MESFFFRTGPTCLAVLCSLLWIAECRDARFSLRQKAGHSVINLALFSGKVLLQGALGFMIAKITLWSQLSHFGLFYRFDMPDPLRWVLSFIVLDLGGY